MCFWQCWRSSHFISYYFSTRVKTFQFLKPSMCHTLCYLAIDKLEYKSVPDMFQPDLTAFDWKMQQGVRKTIVYLAVKYNPNVILRSGHWITSWQWRNLWSSHIFYLFLVCDNFRRLGQRGSFTDKNLFLFCDSIFLRSCNALRPDVWYI